MIFKQLSRRPVSVLFFVLLSTGAIATASTGVFAAQTQTGFRPHPGDVRLVISPDGQTLITGGTDETINVWDLPTARLRRTLVKLPESTLPFQHSQSINSLALSPDGKTLAAADLRPTGQPGIAKLWDLATGQERVTLTGHKGHIYSVAFSPDGRLLATGGGGNIGDYGWEEFSHPGPGELKLWDANTGSERASLTGHKGMVASVVFSPDGKTLASSSKDTTARLWDVSSGQELFTLSGHSDQIDSVAFAPDGKTLATASSPPKGTGDIRVWDRTTGRHLAALKGPPQGAYIVLFAPDGKTLAAGGMNTVKLWDTATWKERATLRGPGAGQNPIRSLAFTPDSKTLVTGSWDGSVQFRDTTSGQQRTLFNK